MIEMFSKFKGLIEILRPFNCFMAAIAVWLGFVISVKHFSFDFHVFLLMLSAFFVCGAGQTINDVFDFNIDRKIRPNKVLPSGRVSRNLAIIYSFALFLVGSFFGFYVGLIQFLIALVFSFLLIFYSAFLSKLKFLGNWVVALGTAFTLIYGASLSGNYSLVLVFAFSVLLANVGREITKDLEDLHADEGYKMTMPMVLGERNSKIFVYVLYSVAVLNAFLAASIFFLGKAFILSLSFCSAFFVFSAFLLSKNKPKNSHFYSKVAMFLALISFALSIL